MKRFTLLLTLIAVFVVIAVLPTAAQSQRNFRTHLDAEDAGADSQAQGQAIFQISKDGTSMTYKIIVANLENVRMAHIHLAPPGVNGPVVAWLYPAGPPPVVIPGTTNGILAEGTLTAASVVGPLAGEADPWQALLDAIAAGNTYVNVHTNQYPGGEIRGQIG